MSGGAIPNQRLARRARSALRRIASAFLALAMALSLVAHASHAHQPVAAAHAGHAVVATPAESAPSSMDEGATVAGDECCQCCAPAAVFAAATTLAPRVPPATRPVATVAAHHAVHHAIESPPPRA